jgi:hypothetical protein
MAQAWWGCGRWGGDVWRVRLVRVQVGVRGMENKQGQQIGKSVVCVSRRLAAGSGLYSTQGPATMVWPSLTGRVCAASR